MRLAHNLHRGGVLTPPNQVFNLNVHKWYDVMKPAHSAYIPEIDALRAIAVLLVVAFHAVPAWMPGGFIGVDVFFVISGFVISRSYLNALISRDKSLTQFYHARFRRLAPALLLVVLMTALATAFISLPRTNMSFATSLLSQVFYVQNFVFWAQGDYWSNALSKPLLHTWSLAVEEQFYFFWAILILFFRRFSRSVLAVVMLMIAASVVIGIGLEPRSPKTVFYLLPTRLWQFGLGVLAWLIVERFQFRRSAVGNALVCLCALSIVATGLFFGPASTFPGPQAYIACFATVVALVLLDQKGKPPRALNWSPFNFIGRVSYGFYLWHWPPLALFFLAYDHAAPPFLAALMMLGAFGAAFATYVLVESPVRHRRLLPTAKQLGILVLSGSAMIAAVSGVILSTHGLIQRYPAVVRPYLMATTLPHTTRCGKLFVLRHPSAEFCPLTQGPSNSGTLLLGDSHADVLAKPIATYAARPDLSVYLTTRSCDLGTFGASKYCSDALLDTIIHQARAAGVKHVVSISLWQGSQISAQSLEANLRKFVEAGLPVTLVKTVPRDQSYSPELRALAALNGEPLATKGLTAAQHNEASKEEGDIMKRAVAAFPGHVSIVDPADWLCDATQCHYELDGTPLYVDDNHLSPRGIAHLKPMLQLLLGIAD